MITWSEVDSTVLSLAQEIIHLFHKDLADARVGFVFRSEGSASQGKTVWAKAAKVPPKLTPLLDLDFVVWIAEDIWEKLDIQKRRALIDHELCHCDFLTGMPKMKAHDIEEFQCIIERYGFWNVDLFRLKPTFEKAIQFNLGLPAREQPGVVALDPAIMPKERKGSTHKIEIDLDKHCARCGTKGAAASGYCLECENSLRLEGSLESVLEEMLSE